MFLFEDIIFLVRVSQPYSIYQFYQHYSLREYYHKNPEENHILIPFTKNHFLPYMLAPFFFVKIAITPTPSLYDQYGVTQL